ncbi:MAG: SH3 domain-containing protein [Oscillospiraceae bacterium]|nr:SH3 domain-containing protein [Oscillospiraceae bacterium]
MNSKGCNPTCHLSAVFSIAFRIICITAMLSLVAVIFGCKKPDDKGSQTNTTTSATPGIQTPPSESDTTTGTIPNENTSFGWCNADSLHARSGPGSEYFGIGELKHGEKVTIVGREGDWFKIQFADGFAFVSAQFIQSTEIIPTQAEAKSTTTLPAQ